MGLSLGLVGYPIQHSMSPWIHQQFMSKLGVKGQYNLYETKEEDLEKMLTQLKELQIDGFNITVPYKQAVMKFLDELHPDAQKIGAVNTVALIDGKWKGYNTDGQGYVKSVKTTYPELFCEDNRVLILGAGGAARGIYRALVQEKFLTIDIANRTKEKAEALLDLKTDTVTTHILSFEEAMQQLQEYDFIVQTTSVGMKSKSDATVIPLNNLKKNTVVSDIVYQPLMTPFLKEAKKYNGRIHQGHAMLVYQAQLAFQIWSGKQFSPEDTLKQLEERMRGNE